MTNPVTLYTLQEMKRRREKFVCITAYDALFAKLMCAAGAEVLLVGDSLGMVLQGHTPLSRSPWTTWFITCSV
jgi:3-methyl-2-oxobutanoate hydroxymethyltransferase